MRVKFKQRRKAGSFFNSSRSWVAVGTLAAYSAAGGGKTALAQSQSSGRSGAASASQTLVVRRFDIPAGPLDQSLAAFQTASGWTITVPDAALLMIQAKGVSGILPVEQALRQMLEGTQIRYRMTGPQSAVVELAPAQASVDVVERAPVSSPRYTSPLRDLPQTISVVPREVIEQQGATTLRDVLRNVPGLTMTAGEGGVAAGDNLTVRGYSARNDIFVDGVRDLSPQSRDPFNLEQVEVTKGPTSAVYGRGSAGGTINLVSKGPNINRILGFSVGLGNADTRRFSADLNTSLKRLGLGERTGLRTNLLWHDSGVPGRDVVKNDRWGVAPTLAFGLGTPTRVTLGYYKLRQNNISDYGIPWVPATNNALAAYRDMPAPVPRNTFYGFKDRDYEALNQDTGTVKVEHDFSDKTSLRSQLRYGRANRDSIATPPRFASNDSTEVNRELRAWIARDYIWDSQTDLRANFDTGSVTHALVTGGAFTNENNVRYNRTAPNSATTLLNPNPNDVYTGLITTSPIRGDITGKTQALWAFDTMRFGSHWEATGGARWERFDVKGTNTTPAPVTQNVKMASVRAGLIYKPVQRGSVYASYGNSLSPSLEGLSYTTSNTSIPPEKTYTTEVGTKWEVAGNRMLLSAAVFRVAKDNARTPGLLPTDPPQVLAGTQVSKGIELSATGGITRYLRVLGAYTYMEGKINSSNNPAEVGKYFINMPRHSASLWITYTARKFTVAVGPRAMSERFGNNTNSRRVDGYWTFDAMAGYTVNRHLDLRLNLTNLNDAFYFDRLGGGHVIPGVARGVLGTANVRF